MKKLSVLFMLVFQFITVILFSLCPMILLAQKKIVEIKILKKQYEPPGMTAKIPKEFKDNGVRLAVRAGDIIRICNNDEFVARPFSISKGNSFEGTQGGGLRPGNCMTVTAKNETNQPLQFKLYDEIHSRNILFLVVLPSRWPDEGEEISPSDPRPVTSIDITGTWTDNDKIYTITQFGSSYTWDTEKTREHGDGELDGNSITKQRSGYNGEEKGTVMLDASGKPTKIQWNNGVVFTRKSSNSNLNDNWAGTYVGTGHTVKISGSGTSLSAEDKYDQGGGSWTGCTLNGNEMTCKWTGHHEDQDKTAHITGTVVFSLQGNSISGSYKAEAATVTFKPGIDKYESAIKPGAVWPFTMTRQK